MQSQVDELSPVLLSVKVEVPWDDISQDMDSAYRKLQKNAKIRGFRPGKVPRNVVQKLMGPAVRNDVANTVVQRALGEAIKEHHLHPVNIYEVEAPDLTEGAAYVFTAKVEVRPTIEQLKLDDLAVERKKVRVSDAMVDAELLRLREENGELVAPDPARPAKDGDTLTFSVSVAVDGAERPDLSSEKSVARVGAGRLLPELEAALPGLEIDVPKTVDVTFPEDYGRKEVQGVTAQLTLTVSEMQENQLPDLDDEFAKDLEYDSLDAMKTAVRKQLEDAEDRKAQSLLHDALIQKLIDENPVPVPPSMVERQYSQMLQEFMQFQRMLNQMVEPSEDDLAGMKNEAERKARGALLLGEITQRENLAVTDEEIDKELSEIAERTGQHVAKVRAEHQGNAAERLHSRILENKLLEYLRSKATITETEVDAETSDE